MSVAVSTEEICVGLDPALDPILHEINADVDLATSGSEAGDEAAVADALANVERLRGDHATTVRGFADSAADEDFAQALRKYADETEAALDLVVAGDLDPDLGAQQAAELEVARYCAD